ncbi:MULTISPECIES: hypothetical protein [Streptomycetaceae]|uniref:Uncharacterized protein n=1 Tax=Streptantibioticus cattleyicolor (strain ATCC 35852 / DSM 46488 / JCM 4925 / NBRC 14057 / NRRL 8057) TaxID=1003195 RepID=F8JXJ9_STREN|nr:MULTISPECIES: hypothetical protein [Streptomycetaceae]AEW95889.1 hypothetical protein SCATT_35180 [Streptantibioticus cattleyicolor NRRL 8057 = DSM 46488]MYS60427.1 hypothetical protein [Streptomyces sp. SID5468]CCB76225.1 protein of unknown function [Streptantibioticus cattleyicolor NRRL 8057 = DSM 46488]
MDAQLIAATVLFGPAAVALPVHAVLWRRGQQQAAAERAVFAELRDQRAATARPTSPPPPPPGEPVVIPAESTTAPAPVLPLRPSTVELAANVIDLASRRRTA